MKGKRGTAKGMVIRGDVNARFVRWELRRRGIRKGSGGKEGKQEKRKGGIAD